MILVSAESTGKSVVDEVGGAAEWILAVSGQMRLAGADSARPHLHQLVQTHSHSLEAVLHVAGTPTESLGRFAKVVQDWMVPEPEASSIGCCNCSCSHSDQSKADSHSDKERKMIETTVDYTVGHSYSSELTKLQQLVGDIRSVEGRRVEHYQKRNLKTQDDSKIVDSEGN